MSTPANSAEAPTATEATMLCIKAMRKQAFIHRRRRFLLINNPPDIGMDNLE